MELNSSVNTFIGGMNLDSDISLLKENQYTYAENIRLLANEDSTTGVLQNRDCLKKFESQINGQILGTTVTRVFKDNTSVECIVVITNDNDINNIYLIYTEGEIECNLFASANFGWSNNLKIISNCESDDVSKLYIIDGKHSIKIINLNSQYQYQNNSEHIDISPDVVLYKPRLLEIIRGNLMVGTVQYAYQLFIKNGAESEISPVSEPIIIPEQQSVTDTNVHGGVKGKLSNIGCSIRIDLDDTTAFDHIRIYRIRYNSNNDIAQIQIASESEIYDKYVIYNDIKDIFISEITVDEFNALTLKRFIPKTIEKHDNRLFAAGIEEVPWNPIYDARAYRCDLTGQVQLYHSDVTQNITCDIKDAIVEGFVPEKHDCINPSNELLFEQDSFKYIYGLKDDRYILGGSGPNISYEFCFTEINCSDSPPYVYDDDVYPAYNLSLKCDSVLNKIFNVTDINNEILYQTVLKDQYSIANYSNSWFTANFLGYQRDEIYRFGIIFYNKKSQKSPVHWIGDIRIPMFNSILDYEKLKTFDINHNHNSIFPDPSAPDGELISNAIGIKFTVKNIPEDAVTWEIVRCPRTEIDRTIVAQAYLSELIQFDGWEDRDPNFGQVDIRPMALLNTGEFYRVQNFDDGNNFYGTFNTVDYYYELISPEICVSKQSIVDNIKSSKVCPLYYVENRIPKSYEDDIYSSDTMWGIRQEQIHTLSQYNEELKQNNYGLGAFSIKDNVEYFAFGIGTGGFWDDPDPDISLPDMYGGALLLKYYKQYKPIGGVSLKTHTIKDAIYPTILPLIYTVEESKNYAQPIGSKIYTNTTVGGVHQLNTHGQCVVINTDTVPITVSDKQTACVVNIKQHGTIYGGNTFASRVNSTYISCVSHKTSDDEVCTFGGDTYLGVFDYVHTSMSQNAADADKNRGRSLFINCYLPIESTVNMYLFNNESYKNTVTGMIGQNLLQNEPTATGNYAQKLPLYEYNSAYSADPNAQIFVPQLMYADNDPIFVNRIICSELKTSNEIIDSWTKFKFANYLDVDNQYGPVTNLKSFNGKLFFWQDSAVGVASVNERSLIQDNNIAQLTLGTGGILVRYDYHTTLNGSARVNDRSICNSASTLYWYDTDKHEICAINNTVIELSKVKGVKSWCNKLLGRSETLGWYDWKYNEVLFQNKSEDIKRSIVFNEQLNTFTGFYTYPASHVAQMVDKLVTLDDVGNIYTHDSDVNYEPFESKITYVINKGYPETKVFDNVWFDAELSTDETLKSIVFKTKTQETNPVTFEGIENREDTYRFPIPRDKNGVARMRGKYLICDYTFDCTNDGDFKIPYIKTTFRISKV